MGLRSAVKGLSWALKLNRVRSAFEQEAKMYDVKISLAKGAKALAISAGSIAATAALTYLSDPAGVTAALSAAGVSPLLVASLVTVITGAAHFGANWLKNH